MPGPVALIGAGAFLPAMTELNRELLAATGRARPRVVVIAAGDPGAADTMGPESGLGVEHFTALGAEVEPIVIPEREAAADDAALQAIGEADVIYLADGRSGHLCETLCETRIASAIVEAYRRGAVLLGCCGGAGALAAQQAERRIAILPWPIQWRSGLGLLRDSVVLPGYDRLPEPLAAMLALQAPRGSVVLGIDTEAAIIGRDGAWQVHGPARVTVWRGRHRRRYRRGDVFRI